MRKFIEYAVKLILIILVLLGYQSVRDTAAVQSAKTFLFFSWAMISYVALVGSYIMVGMILAYNEHKSGKASLTKVILAFIAIVLVVYPFGLLNAIQFLRYNVFATELMRVLALIFGILLTGLKL